MKSRGFSLLELVMVIAIMGVLSLGIMSFLKAPIEAYTQQSSRLQLSAQTSEISSFFQREIAGATPNSIRLSGGACAGADSGTELQLTPARAGGRYRFSKTAAGAGLPLDLTETGTSHSFDVLDTGLSVPVGAQLVINNTGEGVGDLYSGQNLRSLTTTGAGLTQLTYSGSTFSEHSPTHRLNLVTDSVAYRCNTAVKKLEYMSGAALSATFPTDWSSAVPLATDVTECCFVKSAALGNTGAVTMRVSLSRDNETVTLIKQTPVDNTP